MQIKRFGVSRMDRKLMALNEELTDIVQIPAIVSSGSIKLLSPELLKLDKTLLKEMAVAMGGDLVYMKLRATYTELEVSLCNFDGCFNRATDLWCTDHPNGKAVRHDSNIRPLVNPRPHAS